MFEMLVTRVRAQLLRFVHVENASLVCNPMPQLLFKQRYVRNDKRSLFEAETMLP